MLSAYLDHNATTPLLPAVAVAMREVTIQGLANPSSQHSAGRRARQWIDQRHTEVARWLGARVDEPRGDRLLWTSGGTEANNLALLGLAGQPPARVLISAQEHASVASVADELARRGHVVEQVSIRPNGVLDLAELVARLDTGPVRLVSVVLAQSDTGIVQPLAEIAAHCRQRGVLLHTDAAQAVGKWSVDFRTLGVTALSFTAHKFHGPLGIGGLLLADDAPLQPILFGGPQQERLRPGTEPVALITGLHAALELAHRDAATRRAQLRARSEQLESMLRAQIPDLVVHGAHVDRVPGTSLVSFPGVDRQMLLIALDLAGVACSSGSACASGSAEPSAALRAMGVEPHLWRSALRFSAGATTTAEEVSWVAERILQCYNRLRQQDSADFPPRAARESALEPLQ